MHLDKGIDVRYITVTGNVGTSQRKRLSRRQRQSGARQAGSWWEGAPDRRARPRSPECDIAPAVRARAESGGQGFNHMAADRKLLLSQLDTAIAYLSRAIGIKVRAFGVVALLALALLSTALMVLFPQQVDLLATSSFTLPAAAAAPSSAASPFRQVQKRT